MVDVSTPLASQQSPFPLTAGSLFVSVTDPSGARTLHEIAIDPATQSLNDLAVAISSVSNLNATVNSSDGTLAILAAPGYQFDFAGGLETNLDLSGVSGTAIPQITALPACHCQSALASAIITDPDLIPKETQKAWKPLIGKYIPSN